MKYIVGNYKIEEKRVNNHFTDFFITNKSCYDKFTLHDNQLNKKMDYIAQVIKQHEFCVERNYITSV